MLELFLLAAVFLFLTAGASEPLGSAITAAPLTSAVALAIFGAGNWEQGFRWRGWILAREK